MVTLYMLRIVCSKKTFLSLELISPPFKRDLPGLSALFCVAFFFMNHNSQRLSPSKEYSWTPLVRLTRLF